MFIENKWHVLGLDWAVDFNTQMSYMQRSKNEQWKIMLPGNAKVITSGQLIV